MGLRNTESTWVSLARAFHWRVAALFVLRRVASEDWKSVALILLAMHLAAALKHQFCDRDDALRQMWRDAPSPH